MNPYLELTSAFNAGSLRAVVSSGQAVVLHRLSLSSKDGDWILRETPEALAHVLGVLSGRGAAYRFGAPLDVRWLRGGWSAHFEHMRDGLRLRTDFVTRPPRLSRDALAAMWRTAAHRDPPVVDPWHLIALKQTGRERDYAVIGELARLLRDPEQQLLASRSAADLLELVRAHRPLAERLRARRPLLHRALEDSAADLEAALDAERRHLMHADAARIARYLTAAEAWAARWPTLWRALQGRPLLEQHERIVEAAQGLLPFDVAGEPS